MSPEEGFDCSSFVKYVLSQAGIFVPSEIRHCNEFFDQFGVLVHWGCHKEGDLVFFSWRGRAPRHMGIVLDQEYYIDSPGKDGTKIEISPLCLEDIQNIDERAIYKVNPIGFKRVTFGNGRWKKIY